MGIGGLEPEVAPASANASAKNEADPHISAASLRWAGLLVAITGGVSMGLEVLAARSLALLFGSSLQAFAIVLMAFILGIGLGAGMIASPRWKQWRSEPLVVFLLLGAAAWVGLLVFKIEWWIEIYRYTKSGINQSTVGYTYHQVLTGAIAMFVLGVGLPIGAALLLLGSSGSVTLLLAVLLGAAGLDLMVTGALGHCPLYAKLGHVPASLKGRTS